MKKFLTVISCLVFALFFKVYTVNAIAKQCVYKGSWEGKLFSGDIDLTLSVDLDATVGYRADRQVVTVTAEPGEGSKVKEYQNIGVINYYQFGGAGEWQLYNYYSNGLANGNPDTRSFFDYVYDTGSCPDSLIIFDKFVGGSTQAGHTALLYNEEIGFKSGVYDDFSDIEVIARLKNQNTDYASSKDSSMTQCDYTIRGAVEPLTKKMKDIDVSVYVTGGGEISASSGVYIFDSEKEKFKNCKNIEKVYTCTKFSFNDYAEPMTFIATEASDGFYSYVLKFTEAVDKSDFETYNISCKEAPTTALSNNSYGYSGCAIVDEAIYYSSSASSASKKSAYITQGAEYCRAYMNTHPFDISTCMEGCINFRKNNPTLFDTKDGTCSFSIRIISWIENILRWVRYIIPVVVIVLSILEFMSALSSEKDDEFKKAQKHLVVRLAIAAVIFILPIIIEFVLNKLGFSADSCGISNLGLGK